MGRVRAILNTWLKGVQSPRQDLIKPCLVSVSTVAVASEVL